MRLPVLAVLASMLVFPAPAQADVVQQLDGLWQGEDMVLALDVERGQGRVDRNRPFQWERFIVKSVAGNQVVFTIGPRLYSATVDAEALIVEAPGFAGPQRLTRVDPAVGAPAAGEAAVGEAPPPAAAVPDAVAGPAAVPNIRGTTPAE